MESILKIQIPIFNDTLQVFFGDPEDAVKALVKDGISESNARLYFKQAKVENANGIYSYLSQEDYSLIWMPNIPKTVKDYANLVHELQHFVFYFLERRGFTHSADSDEMYSYLLEFVYGEVDSAVSNNALA